MIGRSSYHRSCPRGSQIPPQDAIVAPGASYAVARNPIARDHGAHGKPAMEMPALWKPQNGFHSALEISHTTRDSHIPTADHPLSQKGEDEERRLPGATADQQEDLNDLDLRICLDKWVHFRCRVLTPCSASGRTSPKILWSPCGAGIVIVEGGTALAPR